MRSIAEVIGRVLGLPVQVVPAKTYGILGNLFALDQPSSSAWTREKFEFDWRPSHPNFLADLEQGALGVRIPMVSKHPTSKSISPTTR